MSYHYRLHEPRHRRRATSGTDANCALAFWGFALGFILAAAVVAHSLISAGLVP